jgi:hypothetical protein
LKKLPPFSLSGRARFFDRETFAGTHELQPPLVERRQR